MDLVFEFLSRFKMPYFFDDPADPTLKEVQTLIRSSLEKETTTISVEMEQWLIDGATKNLREIGWTLEESMILFLKWMALFPERVSSWLQSVAMDRLLQLQKPYHNEDKLPISRLESDDFEAAMDEVQRDGLKVIVDADGYEQGVIMAWWLYKARIQICNPEHAEEQISDIERACAEYGETQQAT